MVSVQLLANEFIENKTEKSFKKLVDRLETGLKKYIFGILKDHDSTEDMYIQTLVKAYTKIDSYNNHFNFSTWVYRIARNEALQELNKKKETVNIDFIIDNTSNSDMGSKYSHYVEIPEEYAMNDEEFSKYEMAKEAISKLSSIYSSILMDYEVEGLSYNELAEKYDLKLNTVKIRLLRARNLVKESLNLC